MAGHAVLRPGSHSNPLVMLLTFTANFYFTICLALLDVMQKLNEMLMVLSISEREKWLKH